MVRTVSFMLHVFCNNNNNNKKREMEMHQLSQNLNQLQVGSIPDKIKTSVPILTEAKVDHL